MKFHGAPVFFFFALLAVSAGATTFVNRPLGDVVKETPNIARGRPGDSYSEWDKDHRNIYTYTHFIVTEVLRGKIDETRILLRQPGGQKDGIEMNVPGTAHFMNEEDIVVFLGEKNKDDNSYDIPGFTTGKYAVAAGENGEPVLVNSMGGAAIYDPNKDARTLSYNSKIPLEVFRRVAKGEDIPEAAHRQYEGSSKPAPAHAFESHAHHRDAPKQKLSNEPSPSPVIEPVREPEKKSNGLWIPLSFAVMAIAGAWVLWKVASGKGDA